MSLSDPWIAKYSPVDPAKLHAIGVVAMSWNLVERLWEEILWECVEVKPETGQRLTRGMGIVTIMENAVQAAEKGDPLILDALKNATTFTMGCNANRNHLIHANVTMSSRLVTGRSKVATLDGHLLPDELAAIRKVAEELIQIRGQLWDIVWFLIQGRGGPVKNAALPRKLSPPKPLVEQPQTKRNKPQRQPKLSRQKSPPPKA